MVSPKHLLLFLLLFGAGMASVSAQAPSVIHIDDLEARLNQDNDSLYIVNFWATWCRPCVMELPFFDEVQEKYKDQPVKVLLVSLDFVQDLDSKVVPFIARRKPTSEIVLLDEPKYNTWMGRISEEWTGAIPATLYIRNSDETRIFHEGDYTRESLFEPVDSIL